MKPLIKLVAAAVALAASAALAADPAALTLTKDMQGKIDGLPKDLVARIDGALPKEAPAKPAKARKLLVYMESKGYYHDSIPMAGLVLKKMGEKTGAYEATLTDDESVWTADTLNQFDGVFMDNTVGEHPKTAEGKKAFIEYIKSGKGLMGTHAATDCNHPWAEYFDMIGGEFAGHPWGQISVRNEDPKSPVNAAFKGDGFYFSDEIYTFKPTDAKRAEGYSRDKLHILLSIDMEKSGYKDTTRKDMDYAVSWVKKYGDGRVFYCSLGHNQKDFITPALLEHYLAGIQYALGDLKGVEDAPTKKLPADGTVPGPDKGTKSLNVK